MIPPSLGWLVLRSVIIALNVGNLHFFTPIGALVGSDYGFHVMLGNGSNESIR